MHRAVKETPQSYALLHVQVDFLRSKGKHEWAARLAKQAVNCAPSEFVTWAKLTECYIELGQWESVSHRWRYHEDCHVPGSDSYLSLIPSGAVYAQLLSYVYVQREGPASNADSRKKSLAGQAIHTRKRTVERG